MAKFTVKEFANTYGYKETTVKSWLQRKQMQRDADGKIDTENDKNKLFLMQNQAKNPVKKVASSTEKKVQKEPKEPKQQKTVFPNNPYEKMELEKKQIELEKVKAETQVKKMQALRLAGLSMPTELVESIVISHNKTILNTFWGEIETLVNIICPDREIAVIQLKKLREFYSRLVQRAKDDSLKAIENVIDEYSK